MFNFNFNFLAGAKVAIIEPALVLHVFTTCHLFANVYLIGSKSL